MESENTVRKIHTRGVNRKKLSEITNSPVLCNVQLQDEDFGMFNEAQLQKKLTETKKLLQDKEKAIEENKRLMEELWINYCRKTKQNEEIILHNMQLFKDLMQARDKLKVVQHENAQMSVLHKVYRTEMEEKLAEALEQITHLAGVVQLPIHTEIDSLEKILSSEPSDTKNCKMLVPICEDPSGVSRRSNVKKRESKRNRECSSKMKIREADGNIVSSISRRYDGKAIPDRLHKCSKNEVGKVLADKVKPSSDEGIMKPSSEDGVASGDILMDRNATHVSTLESTSGKLGADSVVAKTDKRGHSFDGLGVSSIQQSGRPLRRAVSSIGSYREPSLIAKMRRPS